MLNYIFEYIEPWCEWINNKYFKPKYTFKVIPEDF